jgi:hypothetical protein
MSDSCPLALRRHHRRDCHHQSHGVLNHSLEISIDYPVHAVELGYGSVGSTC